MPSLVSVCRLEATAAFPDWVFKGSFFSITKTENELSIVCEQGFVPADVQSEKNWRGLQVQGPLDFGLTGILSSLTLPLAEAGISIFALSTYETDYLFVKEENFAKAISLLQAKGHLVQI